MNNEYYATSSIDRYGILKSYAKENRLGATDAEKVIWEYLRAKRMGVKFRRQHPVLDYIVDYVCLDKMLIIEIDGEYHNQQEQQIEDRNRDERLKDMGYTVLRFTNEQVMTNIDGVLENINMYL